MFNVRFSSRFRLILCLIVVSAAVSISGNGNAATPGPGDANPELYAPVLAAQRDAIYAQTEGDFSRFQIDATFFPATELELAMIEGGVDLRFVNQTPDELDELYLRLYANVDEYDTGAMSIDSATAAGEELETELSVAGTLVTIALPEAVGPGEAVDLEYTFTTIIPTDPLGSYGMFSYDAASGTYALAHWQPLLAGYDREIGWLLDPPSNFGDPVFTNTALFDVTLTAPSEFTFVTTGSAAGSDPTNNDTTTHRFVTGPVRDFVMAADTDFEVESVKIGDTTVSSYFEPGSVDGGLEVLTAAAQSLEVYNRLIGAYPFEEMDLVQIDLGNGAGGVEFPQLMFIGSDYYVSDGGSVIPHFLEYIVAHEVGHQWWYALVGNNQYLHAFTDEGITNYLTTVYFGEVYGAAAMDEQVNFNLKASYFSLLFNDGDQIIDQPTDDFPSQRSYGTIIYGKAALGFGAIHETIGDDAFFDALRSYAKEFRFDVALPEDLKAAFEESSGQNLDELWRHWFEAAEGREDFDAADMANLLKEIGR